MSRTSRLADVQCSAISVSPRSAQGLGMTEVSSRTAIAQQSEGVLRQASAFDRLNQWLQAGRPSHHLAPSGLSTSSKWLRYTATDTECFGKMRIAHVTMLSGRDVPCTRFLHQPQEAYSAPGVFGVWSRASRQVFAPQLHLVCSAVTAQARSVTRGFLATDGNGLWTVSRSRLTAMNVGAHGVRCCLQAAAVLFKGSFLTASTATAKHNTFLHSPHQSQSFKMSSKSQMKKAFLGLLAFSALGLARNGQQDELETSQFNADTQPAAMRGGNRLEAAQRFQPQPQPQFGKSRNGGRNARLNSVYGFGGSNNNNQQFDPSQLDDSEFEDDSQPYGSSQRLSNSDQRTRPSRPQSIRFQGGNRGQSQNQQQGMWRGQPGQPIIFNPPGSRQVCPFDEQKGPNILIAQVR